MPTSGGRVEQATGVLAFVGGAAWADEGHAVRELVAGAAGTGATAVVLPTAAAYERPGRLADQACAALTALGLQARTLAVLNRTDAGNADAVAAVREAGLIFLTDGSAMHLHSVLKGTTLYQAVVDGYNAGAVLVASGAGGSVLCDPMIDPRGGAFTVGLGLVRDLTVFPHFDTAADHLRTRTLELRPAGVTLVGVDESTAVVRERDGSWHAVGGRGVTVFDATGPPEGRRYENLPIPALPA